MTALACLAVAIVSYYLGVSRGYLLAEHEAGRGGTGPGRFDAWEGEEEGGEGDATGHHWPSYRAGYRAALGERPSIRERMTAGAEGGREVERGRVLG